MSTSEEAVAVVSEGDVLVIAHHRAYADNVMDDTLVIAKTAAAWLADHLVKVFAPDGVGQYDLAVAPDALTVRFGGTEQEPAVNVVNRRDTTAERGGPSSLVGVTQPLAHELAAKLRAFYDAST